ncbi:uncharacterized protein V6R79_007681 [Siganus canaliculatus]
MGVLEAWYTDCSDEDKRKPHRLNPNQPVSMDVLNRLGVFYYKLNADIYESDPELQKIREEQGYSYMDIVDVCKEKLPDYDDRLRMFFQEHLHLDDEIRYCLAGQAYFDIRDKEERWIRICVKKGDLITLPAGIYHRFTLDESNYAKLMRLFIGEPQWKAYNRPADDFDIRQKYVASLQAA